MVILHIPNVCRFFKFQFYSSIFNCSEVKHQYFLSDTVIFAINVQYSTSTLQRTRMAFLHSNGEHSSFVMSERDATLTGVRDCIGAICGASTVTVCCLSGGRARVIAWSFLAGSGRTCPLRLRATCTKWPAGTCGKVQQGHSEPFRPPGKQQQSMSTRPERRRRRSRLTTAGKTSNVHPRLKSTRTAACDQQENWVWILLKGITLSNAKTKDCSERGQLDNIILFLATLPPFVKNTQYTLCFLMGYFPCLIIIMTSIALVSIHWCMSRQFTVQSIQNSIPGPANCLKNIKYDKRGNVHI